MRLTVTLLSYASCAALAMGGHAHASEGRASAVRLQMSGALPFSPDELEKTVSPRVPLRDRPDATPVVVGPAPGGAIAVQVGARASTVDLAGRTGVEAARLVAVAIADLMAGAPAQSSPVPAVSAATPGAPTAQALDVVAASPGARALSWQSNLAATVQIAHGLGAAEPALYGGALDLVMAARARWLIGAGLGLARAPTQRAGYPDEASLTLGALRVWSGVRAGDLELLAGPLAAPYWLGGAFDRTGVLMGGGVMARYRARLGGRAELVAGVRVDAFANRFRVSAGDLPPSLASPRVALALDVGFGWGLRR